MHATLIYFQDWSFESADANAFILPGVVRDLSRVYMQRVCINFTHGRAISHAARACAAKFDHARAFRRFCKLREIAWRWCEAQYICHIISDSARALVFAAVRLLFRGGASRMKFERDIACEMICKQISESRSTWGYLLARSFQLFATTIRGKKIDRMIQQSYSLLREFNICN
jgi:hypothetical protein